MKWYSPTPCDNTVDDPYVANEGEIHGLEEWSLVEGRAIDRWSELSWVKATTTERDGVPDDVLQTYMALLPIYSRRLRVLLESRGVRGIQYLPIRVMRPDDSVIHGYSVANVLNKVAALDFLHSDYTLFPEDWIVESRRGELWTIEKPVLRGSTLADYHIIRLEESPSALFVSENFRDMFDKEGLTGYSFSEVSVSHDKG